MDGDIKRLLDVEEASGERRGNHVRLGIIVLFLVLFAFFYLKSEQHYLAGYVILADFLALLVYGFVLEWVLRSGRYHPSMKYLSFAADSACVSIVVVASLSLSRGPDPSGWLTAIGVLFLFTTLTGLRFSPSLCVFMGTIAAVEFVIINQLAQSAGGQALPLPQQAAIAVLMVAAGLVLAFDTHNARRLVVRIGLAERERAYLEGVAQLTSRLALTDELTQLPNRRRFLDELQRELLRADRHGRTFAVLSIDVDHFKWVNDNLGHRAGDEVLRQIASVLRQHSRSSDVVARVGGDEFCVLLYEADVTKAEAAAWRLCEAVRLHPFEAVERTVVVPPTLSIGLAYFPSDGREMDTLLTAADKAMYAAKNAGKDRVVSSGCVT